MQLLKFLLLVPCVSAFVQQRTLSPVNIQSNVRASRQLFMSDDLDYDLLIVGCGVGGHGAALHARSCGLKTAIFSGKDVGGTCVNRGCVPSKALLAAAGRVRELKNEHHLKSFGITVGDVQYDRQAVADHAQNLANKVKGGLEGSLKSLGVDIIEGAGVLTGNLNEVKDTLSEKCTRPRTLFWPQDLCPWYLQGSQLMIRPYLPLMVLSSWSMYLSMWLLWGPVHWTEFSDVYTALGSDVTFIEAFPDIMPAFDKEIARMADRILIKPRNIDFLTNVFASEVIPGVLGEKPVTIKMIDATTKEHVETLEVDACMVATGRSQYQGDWSGDHGY
ncbi:unnamed protein product [Heterosigma akashiwo]